MEQNNLPDARIQFSRIFFVREGADLSIVAVYVDHLIVVTETSVTMKIIKKSLAKPRGYKLKKRACNMHSQ